MKKTWYLTCSYLLWENVVDKNITKEEAIKQMNVGKPISDCFLCEYMKGKVCKNCPIQWVSPQEGKDKHCLAAGSPYVRYYRTQLYRYTPEYNQATTEHQDYLRTKAEVDRIRAGLEIVRLHQDAIKELEHKFLQWVLEKSLRAYIKINSLLHSYKH